MRQIFISYRRDDSHHITDRITDYLIRASFAIFKDTTNIMPGRDFPREIEAALKKSEVLLAVIGKHWHIDSAAQSRIQQGDDYVRSEVRAALERGIPIIPVLVNDAHLPAREDLPEDIQGLVYKQTVRVRSDPDFTTDMAMLVRSVHLLAPKRGRSTAIKLLHRL